MSKINTVIFNIETVEAGQRQRYGDSYFHYVITSKMSAHIIKAYCTKILRPAIPQKQYKEELGICFENHFRSYHTALREIESVGNETNGVSTVEYKVVEPSTH